MAVANGVGKGRVVPPLPTYTTLDGITVAFRKIGVMTQQQIAQAINDEWNATGQGEPQPPVVKNNYGTDEAPEWKEERNAADPDYLKQREAWNNRFILAVNDRIMQLAALEAEFEIDADLLRRKRRALARVGVKLFADDDSLEIEEADKLDYFFHIIAADQHDMANMYRIIVKHSRPTEAAVEEHQRSFPGDMEG